MLNSYRFLAEVYDSLMYDSDGEKWASYISELLKKDGILPPARILETACGTGRITLPLVRAGYDLVALDTSEEMLQTAQDKLRENALSAHFVCADMRDFSMPRPVSAIVSACDGLNYLAEEGDALKFFALCAANLIPGGMLLFDISSYKKLTQTIGNNVFYDDGDVVTCLWRNQISGDLLHMDLTLFVREDKLYRRMDEEHVQRAYRTEEIMQMLKSAGFSHMKSLSFLTTDEATEEDERIQFVAVR